MTDGRPDQAGQASDQLPERTLLPRAWRRTLLAVGVVVLVAGVSNGVLSEQAPVGRVLGVLLSVYVATLFLVQALDPRRRVVVDHVGFGVAHPPRSAYRVAWEHVERLEVGRGIGTDHVELHVVDPARVLAGARGSALATLERVLRLRGYLTVTSSAPAPQVRDLMERYRSAARPGS